MLSPSAILSPMLHTPFYDPEQSYEDNFQHGPFGGFADGKTLQQDGTPQQSFLGIPVYTPFGIPAGPLVNGRFVTAAFRKGFDLPVYKTVRTAKKACHEWPNVVPVQVDGDLTMAKKENGLTATNTYTEPLAITNSFGVPSFDPDFWQEDMKQAVTSAGPGQVMIASFQGTNRGTGVEEFIADHVRAARLVQETGAKILEVNYSCPNEGTADLLCFDQKRVIEISARIKEEIGNLPLLVKFAYFEKSDKDDTAFINYIAELSGIVDGFSVINTIPSAIYTKDGKQALPGDGRLVSGVCGAPIKWAGLEMVERLHAYRLQSGKIFAIVGSGGVTTPQDYQEYRDAGADAVMSATGAMWNPWLAQEIKE